MRRRAERRAVGARAGRVDATGCVRAARVRNEVAARPSPLGVGRARQRLVFGRGRTPDRAVGERGDCGDRAVGERELERHSVAGVVEAERVGFQDQCAAECWVVRRGRAAAEDDDRPSGFERRVRGEGEAQGCGVGELHAGEVNRRVRVVEEFHELVVVRAAHPVAVRVALDLDGLGVIRRNVREDFVDDERQAHVKCHMAAGGCSSIVGGRRADVHHANADSTGESG